ncbi:hypothetical protein [Streptomyces sp. RKAG290]|uniref:hypothetical protein n=1 Tax=Streptomyces sp. RKAG290 TaxID=2888348 RepID=UPI00203392AA|nr:hypothetical protein [Streptomyces sp. RKAG290]MCM2413086.1 hypothetical protein [Streptomyces sp. RKAG290]
MNDHADHGSDPARHPELLAWLTERQTAFADWAREAGGADRFDFGRSSLDVLDALLRESFDTDAEIAAQRRGPFVQGAVWYLGEVICRERGTVWKYEPDTTADGAAAPLFDPADRAGVLDTPCVSLPADGPERGLYPLNVLRRMLMEKDALGNPIDEHLVDALEEGYLDDEFDEDEADDADGDDDADGPG